MPPTIKQGNVSAKEISNVDQVVIRITEDKLRLKLEKFKKNMSVFGNVALPIGCLASMLPVYFTSDFKSVMGLSKDRISSFFDVIIFILIVWLIISLVRGVKSYFSKDKDVDTLIQRIKTEQ